MPHWMMVHFQVLELLVLNSLLLAAHVTAAAHLPQATPKGVY